MTDAGPPALSTHRLLLEPLAPAHATEMAPLLDDHALYRYTGGGPVPLDELRERYARQARGRSDDGRQRWFNWIVRETATLTAVGYVQATEDVVSRTADLAWVIGSAHQRRGYAREAASAMVEWLRGTGVTGLTARVDPANAASAAVARAIGLGATTEVVDGEARWRGETLDASRPSVPERPVTR